MSGVESDNSLIQDFLTEASELVESLDAGLVQLESEPGSRELLDQIFRALHTIKGAASFLNLPAVTGFSHAAEDALNRLRKGEVQVTQEVMDALLRSVDVIRGMLDELRAGGAVTPGPAALIDALHEIAGRAAGGPDANPAAAHADSKPEAADDGFRALTLPPQAEDVLPFMTDELLQSADRIEAAAGDLDTPAERAAAAAILAELADGLQSTSDFFGLTTLPAMVAMLRDAASALPALPDMAADEIGLRLRAIAELVRRFAPELAKKREPVWALDTFAARFRATLAGQPSDTAAADAAALIDAELGGESNPPAVPEATSAAPAASPASAHAPKANESAAAPPRAEREGAKAEAAADQTVRVEVSRLEALLNLVGEMVLTKNQILSQSRQLRGHRLPHELLEAINSAAGSLDRLTGELQIGVMRTRMQPLSKLFGRYPRIIRDLARSTGKQIRIEIEGGETEVDKGVLEALADPLVHILRNSADHGLEKPDARKAGGKDPTGTIRIIAEHQGGHVRVSIRDDGKGIDPAVIGAKAIERGLATAESLAAMTKQEILRFIFAAGFSTAEKVSDLSGRGVGMDVVRTNISRLGGSVAVDSVVGEGASIEISIPLTVAILPAMIVGLGGHDYAVPIASIVEIVRLSPETSSSVAGRPVMRLRDSVLPLIDLRERLGEPPAAENGSRFTVVVESAAQRAGLVVDRLVGQQEVVIKPLDDRYTSGGPFSGATICEDGHVSLILDVIQLVRSAQHAAAA